MKLSIVIPLLSAFIASVSAQDTSLSTVKTAFNDAEIPQDLHITFNPTSLLEVTFPQPGGSSVPVSVGVQLPRNDTVGPPHFAVRGPLPVARRFVIATVDPDAPTPQDPTEAQIRHFLAPNFIPATVVDLGETRLLNVTEPISNWLQPTPPAGSPAHRYVFLLFVQPPGFDRQTLVNSTTSVANFNISAFAESTGLGSPIAGTFMLVAPDPRASGSGRP